MKPYKSGGLQVEGIHFSLAMTLLFLFSQLVCAAQKNAKPYSEDLSVYRPKFEVLDDTTRGSQPRDTTVVTVDPTHTVNAKVDAVLDSIDRFNQTRKYVDGFTLQIYTGQKKEDAMLAKQKLMTDAPELIASLQYIQPKFRVTIGAYFTRLEAQKDLMRLKKIFPNTILIPEKIQFR